MSYFGKSQDLAIELDRCISYVVDEHNPECLASDEKAVMVCTNDVPPVLQYGPMCGLVCLTMAEHLLGGTSLPGQDSLSSKCHPDSILKYAQEEGLSKQGEMFSVDAMKKIATDHLLRQAQVVHMDSQEQEDLGDLLVEVLLGEAAMLVPYDADRNHSPCLALGHSAHWCLVTGVCVVLDYASSRTVEDSSILEVHHTSHRPYTIYKPAEFAPYLKALFDKRPLDNFLECGELYVFARQGKSRHLGLWNFNQLLKSNGNLTKVDPKRCNTDYVIGEGGIEKGLKNKILVVKK